MQPVTSCERIETRRLSLTEPVLNDAPCLRAIRNQDLVKKYLEPRAPESLDKTRALIGSIRENNAAGSSFHLAIRQTDGGALIGVAGVWRIDPETGYGEIGYMSDPSTWGRGYMTEALAAYFERLDAFWSLERVRGMVHGDNLPSVRLLERFGFAPLPPLGSEDPGCRFYERVTP